jgi:hypothetical protein
MIKKIKKTILLVGDSHSHIMSNTYPMLSKKFNVQPYCSKKFKMQLDAHTRYLTEFYSYAAGLKFFYLIFKSFKFDYVYLISGPDQVNQKKGLVAIFFYWIFINLYGHKTIMGILDSGGYRINKKNSMIKKLTNLIRYKSLAKIRLLFFETLTVMNSFKKYYGKNKLACIVNYPAIRTLKSNKKPPVKKKLIRIGILGALNSKRKNYKILKVALNGINIEQKKNITLVLLGEAKNGYREPIIENFKKFVNIECQKGYISQDKLEELTLSCHFLISLLKNGYGGRIKGTGSISDARSTKRRLVIPKHADPEGEFSNFCYYYKDSTSLIKKIQLLCKLFNQKYIPISKNMFDLYSNKRNMRVLLNELGL